MGVISHLEILENDYGWLGTLWLVSQEDPNESGPEKGVVTVQKKTLAEEWHHYDQNYERNLLI